MKKIVILISIILTSSCAVYKASSQTGISVDQVKKCNNKMCFIGTGMKLVNKSEENNEVIEYYQGVASQGGGNYLRAVGHGILDVATLGLWEVAGTPIESAIENNPNNIILKAKYAKNNPEKLLGFELYNAQGESIHKYKSIY